MPMPRDGAVFAFSMPKCGSTMMNKALKIINEASGIPDTNLPGRFFRKGIAPSEWTRRDLSDEFLPGMMHRGFRYMPRSLADMPLLQRSRSILLLRDARDAGVSHFYSKIYEHGVPGGGKGAHAERFIATREEARERGIEPHALERAQKTQNTWRNYMGALPRDPKRVRVYRYEDIVFDKARWLRDVYDFFDLPVDDAAITAAAAAVDVFPEQEDITKRARQVTPGNHRAKLSPEAIAAMNAACSDYLTANGYL